MIVEIIVAILIAWLLIVTMEYWLPVLIWLGGTVVVLILIVGILAALSGCTPYLAYDHASDPGIRGDGWDLACIGGKAYIDSRMTAKAGWCQNVRGGNMAEIRVEYDLLEKHR